VQVEADRAVALSALRQVALRKCVPQKSSRSSAGVRPRSERKTRSMNALSSSGLCTLSS
jgi:hypothetical protein